MRVALIQARAPNYRATRLVSPVTIEHMVMFAAVLFALIVSSRLLSKLLPVPEALLLVALGAIATWIVTQWLGWDTGIRAGSFHDLVFFVFLPILVFEAALQVPQTLLMKNSAFVLFLAIVGVALTTVIAGYLIFWGIGYADYFPLTAALLTGALLAATDPVAVVAQLQSLGASARLGVLLEGESLFNDATAIVLFSILLALALNPSEGWRAGPAIASFITIFFGGALVGILWGLIGAGLLRYMVDSENGAIFSLALAYISFLCAEVLLQLSGVMAVLASGLVLAHYRSKEIDQAKVVWKTLTQIANGCVFLLMGLTITLAMFTERWLAMLIAIAAITCARAVTILLGINLLNPFHQTKISAAEQTALVGGGLRGGVTLALALALPTDLDYWWTIQSMAFGVVIFSLVVQAPAMPWLLRRLGLTAAAADDAPSH